MEILDALAQVTLSIKNWTENKFLKKDDVSVYVQDDEPIDAEDGAIWVDTSSDQTLKPDDYPVLKIKKNGEWIEVCGSKNDNTLPRLTTITVLASRWSGTESPYYQNIQVAGVNINSKLDLQPTPDQIAALEDAEIAMMACNNNGSVIVYALNNKPTEDMTMQVLITDVEVIE